MENQTNDPITQENAIADAPAGNAAPPEAPVPAPAQSKAYTDTEINELVEKARKEGYLKGRNEKIEEWLQSTAPDADDLPDDDFTDDDFSCPDFLTRLRPGFWDE